MSNGKPEEGSSAPKRKPRLPNGPQLPGGGSPQRTNYQIWVISLVLLMLMLLMLFNRNSATVEISQSRFEAMVRRHDVKGIQVDRESRVVEVTLREQALQNETYKKDFPSGTGVLTPGSGPHYRFNIIDAENFKKEFDDLTRSLSKEQQPDFVVKPADRGYSSLLINLAFAAFIMFAFWMLMRRMAGGGPGGQIFNIGKSRAALFDAENKVRVTFADVAGLEEAKEEIIEIVDFLKSPGKFTKLGGKIPKGVLLVGPPGTGKTLLAKAVAGEANVPFFSLSGSDFVEMFVGVGAARVRDLFKQAKEKAPCIVFIDEIDAVGRSRGKGSMPGANDERENTLNSLLVEMDGFATDSGVIIMAATNRPDVLDSALLRPGRFDRQISVDRPDVLGREAIFKVHLKPLKLSDDVDARKLAAQTPGFAGAEIANVCNEAALIAARRNKEAVDMQDFQDAVDRVIGGLEKKNKLISPEEKKIVAYHEAGHAVTGWFLEHADPLVKVSIVPRGLAALGYAQYLPREQYLHTTEQMLDEMSMALGGRAAEEVVFGRISTGALSDLERITKMAYSMVAVYGMNERLGNISFYDSKQADYSFTKPYSDATAEVIDEEVRRIVDFSYTRTKNLLIEKRIELEKIAQELLKKEILFQNDLERIIGKRPFERQTHYQEFTTRPADDIPETLSDASASAEEPATEPVA